MIKYILVMFFIGSGLAQGQTVVNGKNIWNPGLSPSRANITPSFIQLDNNDNHPSAPGNSTIGWRWLEDSNGTRSTQLITAVVSTPTNSTQRIRIRKVGSNLTVDINGTQRFASIPAQGFIISEITGLVFRGYDGDGHISEIDNFSGAGVSEDFSNPNSPNWQFYYEANPAQQATIDGGITNGVMRIGSCTSSTQANVYADFTRSLRGNFDIQFDYRRLTSSQGGGDFMVRFTTITAAAIGGPSTATVTTLRTRFNGRTGKVELKKNGIFTRNGFLKFNSRSRLNRRQVLRGYR